MIDVSILRKVFRAGRGLNGFTLKLADSELVGLVGPNGSGKTTLIKILATLQPADSGTAIVAGHDVFTSPSLVKANVGYMADVPGVYQDMRIREFLEFFADAFRLKEPNRTEAIERALQRSGLAGRADDFVEHLSLGWKQRLLLAKTLLHQPKLLLLDEPATGLDPLARIALREQLKELHQEGIAILISSHILSDLEDICTRIVFIAGGKNVEEADPAPDVAGDAITSIRCEINFLGSPDTVDQVVAGVSGARVLKKKSGSVLVELPGGFYDSSAFLSALLAAGLTITHFDARGPGLEERYLRAFGGPQS
jgi:ABC-2 type transport system ATP-binding protein